MTPLLSFRNRLCHIYNDCIIVFFFCFYEILLDFLLFQ